jgi:peptidyl-prolyl cis-trans isomerase SurA
MIKTIKTKFSTVLFLVLLIPVSGMSSEISNRVVAIVNNDVITLYELNNRIKMLTGKTSEEIKAQDEASFIETRRQILDAMVTEKIAQEKILELGLEVSEDRVDAYVENIKKTKNWTQEDLIEALKKQGLTLESFRQMRKKEMEQQSLIDYEVQSKAVILEGQLQKYYQDNLDKFKGEEQVKIAGIFLMIKDQENKDEVNQLTKKAENIYARLKAGEDFGTIAKTDSQGPGAEEGGEIGEFDVTQIDPELKKIIDGLKDGEISTPINKPTVIQIVKLLKRTGGNVKSFEEVRNDIYDTIYNEELEKRYTSWMNELKEKSFTKINF